MSVLYNLVHLLITRLHHDPVAARILIDQHLSFCIYLIGGDQACLKCASGIILQELSCLDCIEVQGNTQVKMRYGLSVTLGYN